MSKCTEAARGQACSVRVPGVCNHSEETTVAAHLPGGGMGMKRSDIHVADACSACHEWLDGGYVKTHTRKERDWVHLWAVIETQERRLQAGLIQFN